MTDGRCLTNRLDPKTSSLVQIGVLAALGLEGAMPLQIALARGAGATKDEVISALMIGIPSGQTDPEMERKATGPYEAFT